MFSRPVLGALTSTNIKLMQAFILRLLCLYSDECDQQRKWLRARVHEEERGEFISHEPTLMTGFVGPAKLSLWH